MFYVYLPWYLGGLAAWLGLLTYLISFRYPRRVYLNGRLLRPDKHNGFCMGRNHYVWARGKPVLHFKLQSGDELEVQKGLTRRWIPPSAFDNTLGSSPYPSRVEETVKEDLGSHSTDS